jgi:ABC-type cobalamin/Fe3+-siderophores transport system ATPase subunit
MGLNMLKIESLSVSYGARQVLHTVSLDLQAGEILALIGPNGAGKSTLVRAVSGVIPVQRGKVSVDGVDLLGMTAMRRARYLAVVPQAVALPPAFTAWETVLLGRTPYLNFLGHVSSRDEEKARMALQKVDALDLVERRVGNLSGGEQQRVLLARALAQSTPILFLDEPNIHLDLQHQVNLMETICVLAHADHLAVMIALHDLNLAARYADRMALLVSGEIKASGTPRQVLTPEIVSTAYHLPVKVVPHPFAEALLVLPDSQ